MKSVKKCVLITAGVFAMTMAGCSFRTEIDYLKQLKTASRTPSGNLTGDREQYKSSFHVDAESRINDLEPREAREDRTNANTELKPIQTRPDQSPPPPPQVIVIQSGPPINRTTNIHVGVINNYSHVYLMPSPTEIPERPTTTQPVPASPPRLDERCERLERQHEATLRKWRGFFE